MTGERYIAINGELDIVAARVEGRNLAKEMGFGVIDQARIATVISELTRNIVLYADRGQVYLNQVRSMGRIGLEVVCEDQGPGIPDVDRIVNRQQPVGQEMGMGLSGVRRLVDEFEIQTDVGTGTKVTVRKWLP